MSDKNLSGNLIPSTTKSPKRPPIPSFHLPILSQESLLDHESEESVSSIASLPVDSDDSSSEDDVPLSLQERMLRNQERNSHFLQLLHEKYNDQLPPPSNKPATIRKRKTTASDTLDEEEPRGMLRLKSVALPSSDSLDQRLQTLLENYPHRHAQIRRLMALLHAPSTVPIFVTGPRGTGKTSIVRDVLYALEGNAATINCQTLEPASMERLVADALKQLLRRKRKLVNADVEQVPKDLMPQKSETRPAVDPPPTKTSSLTDDIQHRLQPQRAAKLTAPNPLTPIVLRKSIVDDPVEASSHSAVVAFGRSLRRLSRMAVLVLDHAERLPQNGLAELLLLPKVMRLSLRIVLISRYAILKGMRLDTLASPEKSSATLTTSVGGSTILFPAYQESAVIKNVSDLWQEPGILQPQGLNGMYAPHFRF